MTRDDSNHNKENLMAHQQAQATVRAVYDGFNAGDVPTLLSLVTDDLSLIHI